MKTIRIGSGAGYGGDRIEPAIDLMERGNLDYIIFECLAERTIALAQLQYLQDASKGYNDLFEYRMDKILDAWSKKPVKVITNMGAANPIAAMKYASKLARSKGIHGLKIAAVSGDNLLDRIPEYYDSKTIETGQPLGEFKDDIVSANAYIGCSGIVKALHEGADIVITGRTADPSLVLGPLVYEFGWDMDGYEVMGKGTLAGHLLECAGQITGGYYAEPGVKDVPDLWDLGYPIAEINDDGSLMITKLPGTGGLVSEDTCKEQIIYELQDPANYYTPDCTADFSKVSVRQAGENRVVVSGATGKKHNGSFKVSVGYQDCYIGEGQISYAGNNAKARAELAAEVIRRRLVVTGVKYDEIRIDYIGVNSLYADKISSQIQTCSPVEVRLRIAARTRSAEEAEKIGNEVEALYTNGPAGGGGAVKSVRKIISVASILVPQDMVSVCVDYEEVD